MRKLEMKAKKSRVCKSATAILNTMKREASFLCEQAKTGKIDRAYFIYFANLETSLENVLENFPR